MFAEMLSKKLNNGVVQATSTHYYLDWRWVEHIGDLPLSIPLVASSCRSFLEDEKQEWNGLLTQEDNGETCRKMETLIAQSRERNLSIALQEQHEPQLWYPAIPLDEVHTRIHDFLQLDAQVIQYEPNAIVRRLYHDAIGSQMNFLRLIEAAAVKDNQHFQQYNQLLNSILLLTKCPTHFRASDA